MSPRSISRFLTAVTLIVTGAGCGDDGFPLTYGCEDLSLDLEGCGLLENARAFELDCDDTIRESAPVERTYNGCVFPCLGETRTCAELDAAYFGGECFDQCTR